ncbi:acyl-CoA carboxylase subunit epsilon [Streptomyces sp. NPDC058653]|uniref:acyl-CoA carboxylase subunit epsilon n=1 Tax=Streptomyces sp. NPDC058653 TaxID=3346576 RepID=UPI0036580454
MTVAENRLAPCTGAAAAGDVGESTEKGTEKARTELFEEYRRETMHRENVAGPETREPVAVTPAEHLVRVVRGAPGEMELAALLAVLTTLTGTKEQVVADSAARQRRKSAWREVRYTPPTAWTAGRDREWRH